VVITVIQWLVGYGIGTVYTLFFDPGSAGGRLVQTAVTGVAQIVLSPLLIIADILLYYDFRIRKEGFDLEMLSRAFELVPQSTEAQALPHF